MGSDDSRGTDGESTREDARAATVSDETLEALQGRVFAAVRRTCPPWLASQAVDIAQTVLTQLVSAVRRSEGKRTLSAMYLEKAAAGTIANEIRRLSRLKENPVGGGDVLDQSPAPMASPEQEAGAMEIPRGIQQCLLGLERPRRLAVLVYLQGCTVPETARRLGWSGKKAENLVYRGLADLRRCLRLKGLTPRAP